jgi:hypothetical protein
LDALERGDGIGRQTLAKGVGRETVPISDALEPGSDIGRQWHCEALAYPIERIHEIAQLAVNRNYRIIVGLGFRHDLLLMPAA